MRTKGTNMSKKKTIADDLQTVPAEAPYPATHTEQGFPPPANCDSGELHGMIAELRAENASLKAECRRVLRRLVPLHEKHHDHEAIGLAKDLLARML
jgi:hypothetical protein